MPLRLRMRVTPPADGPPIDALSLSPDRLAGLGPAEVERLPLRTGGREFPLAELFDVAGDAGETVEIEGDLAGGWMTRGGLIVRGDAGPRAGWCMSGGTLRLEGRAGDYAGEGMTGGLLRVRGDAGDHLAAPLAGCARGLNRGTILVDGSAGRLAARCLRRGLVAIRGDAGEGAACGMLAGSLFVFGRLGSGAGALMRRGTIVGLDAAEPPPTFLPAGRLRFPFLEMFFTALEGAGFAVPSRARGGEFVRLVGDVSGGGVGEILSLVGGA